jgi:hypothetical protein
MQQVKQGIPCRILVMPSRNNSPATPIPGVANGGNPTQLKRLKDLERDLVVELERVRAALQNLGGRQYAAN